MIQFLMTNVLKQLVYISIMFTVYVLNTLYTHSGLCFNKLMHPLFINRPLYRFVFRERLPCLNLFYCIANGKSHYTVHIAN